MKIKLYRSATVGIIKDNFKLLTDPWLVDGEYYGSWSHYPYFDFDKFNKEINSYNAIYISHIHPDHCSPKTLKKINPNIPVYISKYHSKFLKKNIERLGFKVFELENGKRTKLGENFHITIYPADNCDPQLCYKFYGCGKPDLDTNESQQIDSLSVIDDGKFTILNINDCPIQLAKNTIASKVLKDFEKINLLLTGYGGAGPYPQCLENLTIDQKITEGNKKKINFLNQSLEFIKMTEPDYYMPFAGTYVLSGKLNALQDIRGVPSIDEAYNYLHNNVKKIESSKKITELKLKHDSYFDFDKKIYSKKYEKIDFEDFTNYQKDYLSELKLDYEEDNFPNENEIFDKANKAIKNYTEKKNELNMDIKSDIYIAVKDNYLKISPNTIKLDIIKKNEVNLEKNHVIYNIDLRLLSRLLGGPKYAHWQNAEIGSHLNIYRSPNIYERDLYFSTIYLHE